MFRTIAKARSRTARRELDDALRRFETPAARAFAEAVRSIRSRATLRAIARAIESADLEEAIRLVGAEALGEALAGAGLEPGTRSVQDVLLDAFRAGGDGAMAQMPRDAALLASLDLTSPEAVTYLTRNLPTLIREVSVATQDAVREMVLDGFNAGRPAPEIARQIREIVGLTTTQSRAVVNFRRQLETGEMGNGQAPWERRLSAAERQQARSMFNAAAEGRRADRDKIDALVERYRDSLINRRAKNIARTEVHRAFIEGQAETWRQAFERGLMDPDEVRLVWIVTPDDRLRPSHRAIPGMNEGGVRIDQPFMTPFGPVRGPADPHPELINCRCTVALEFDDVPASAFRRPEKPKPEAPSWRQARLPAVPENDVDGWIKSTGLARQAIVRGRMDKAGAAQFVAGVAQAEEHFKIGELQGLGSASAANMRTKAAAVYLPGRNAILFNPSATTIGKPGQTGKFSNSQRETYLSKWDQRVAEGSEEVKSRAARARDVYDWFAVPKPSPQTLGHHEYGHRFHERYALEVNRVLRDPAFRQDRWGVLVSEYGMTNQDEYVAEAFSLYMAGEEHHYRIYPPLLEIFREKDTLNVRAT